MRDYTIFFRGSDSTPIDPNRAPLEPIYDQNHILTLYCKNPLGLFDKLEKKMPQFRSERISLFRDGILFSTNDLEKDGSWNHYYKQADFNDIDYVQIGTRKFMLRLKSGADIHQYSNISKQDMKAFQEKWLTYQKIGDIPANIPLSLDDGSESVKSASSGRTKKGWGKLALQLGFVLLVFFGVASFLRDGESTLCEGRAKYIAEQMPQVMDILSGRYPLQVGVLRSLLNKDGSADIVAQQFVKDALSNSDDGPFICAKDSIILRFNPSGLRTQIADDLEKQLNLK